MTYGFILGFVWIILPVCVPWFLHCSCGPVVDCVDTVIKSCAQNSTTANVQLQCDAVQDVGTISSDDSTITVAQPRFILASPSRRFPQPYRFPVHSVRDSVKSAISSSEPLRTGHRSEIMEAVYQDVSKYTM